MLSPDLRTDIRWFLGGFILTLTSGFGQTYFIAIFAGYLKSDLNITDGEFGSLYTVSTLASAGLLIWAGKIADKFSIRWVSIGVMAGLAFTSLIMASVTSAWMLAFVIFGLRFFGQGMLPHVAMTAIGRWFNAKRGRAVSIASLGFPTAEASLPLLAVAVIGLVGWRMTWVVAAGVLIFLAIPLLAFLLGHDRAPTVRIPDKNIDMAIGARKEWTRNEVLRSRLFYALLPGTLAPAFILTGIFFHQVTIIESKGWELSWLAASFPIMAGASLTTALCTGWQIDKVGARRLLPFILIPLGIAPLILLFATTPYHLPVFMAVVGIVLGSTSTIQGALWAELYGTENLGAIRALATAGMVFSSALSPGLVGILLDADIHIDTQLAVMSALSFAASLWMVLLLPRLNRLATT